MRNRRLVLPVMRKQRSGLVVTISSTAGIAGQMFCTAYAAAKFGIEGWMESLTPEIAPFGIRTMLVEPGFFRTELLTNVWKVTFDPGSNVIEVQIKNLREKLGKRAELIETVRGVGYRLSVSTSAEPGA